MKLHIFELTRAMAKHLRPTVKLTKKAKGSFRNATRKGVLHGITSTGHLRVRFFHTNTVLTFTSDIWEFDPKQEMEQKLVTNKTPAKKASKKAAKKRRTKK